MLAFVFKIYLQKQQGWLQFLDCLYPVNHRGQRQDELHTHSYSVSCQNAAVKIQVKSWLTILCETQSIANTTKSKQSITIAYISRFAFHFITKEKETSQADS